MDIKDSVDRSSEEYRGDSEGIEKEKKEFLERIMWLISMMFCVLSVESFILCNFIL